MVWHLSFLLLFAFSFINLYIFFLFFTCQIRWHNYKLTASSLPFSVYEADVSFLYSLRFKLNASLHFPFCHYVLQRSNQNFTSRCNRGIRINKTLLTKQIQVTFGLILFISSLIERKCLVILFLLLLLLLLLIMLLLSSLLLLQLLLLLLLSWIFSLILWNFTQAKLSFLVRKRNYHDNK